MLGGGMGWEDTLFFVLTIGLTGCALFIGFIVAVEVWRRWSYGREIRKHLQH
jgi:hypothetical protein